MTQDQAVSVIAIVANTACATAIIIWPLSCVILDRNDMTDILSIENDIRTIVEVEIPLLFLVSCREFFVE